MFQPPLYYVAAAALLWAGGMSSVSDQAGVWLRMFNLLCGLGQLAAIFGCLRLLFPREPGKQTAGLVVAAFLPMQIYMFQFISNEPLAAALMAASFYLCLKILRPQRAGTREYVLLGVCLGAALLAKFSAVVIAPIMLVVLAGRLAFGRERRPLEWLRTLGVTVAAGLAVCGWHFGRVWQHFGRPLVGNWDAVSGHCWWQAPGCHTPSYYLAFGRSLVYPLFSALAGFWDAIYSTLWGDGFCSGSSDLRFRPPWDYGLMSAAYLLAVPLTVAIAVGAVAALVRLIRRPRADWMLVLGSGVAMSAAVLYMTLKLPYYAQAKAFYALPAMVPLAALAARGFDLMARPSRWLRAGLWVLLITWAGASYLLFWIHSDSAAARAFYGTSLAAIHRDREAVPYLREAVRLDPQDADALYGLAAVLANLGRDAEAVAEFQEALKINPRDADAHMLLALAWSKGGRREDAISEARQAVTLYPDHPGAYNFLAIMLDSSGKTDEAEAAYREALRTKPDEATARRKLALLLEARGGWDEARAQLSWAVAQQPSNADARASLAWLLAVCPDARLRDGPEAVRLAEEAAAQSAVRPAMVLDARAAAYAEVGRWADAIRVAREAVRQYEQSHQAAQADEARARLRLYEARQPYRAGQ
jgi:Flp pilus assembly protein TadD/4-amino-4-deoxy-L-arabinose transferase-like glycosyltransferase